MNFSVLLLAGGRSRRLGQDKRFINYRGKSIFESALEIANQISDDILILISGAKDRTALKDLARGNTRFLEDASPGAGPMGSLIGGLRKIKNEYALLLGVDFPLMSADFLVKLSSIVEKQNGLAHAFVPISGNHLQVSCAFYHVVLAERLNDSFEAGERSIWNWLKAHEQLVTYISEERWAAWANSDVFFNLNTPEDLKRLYRHY